MAPSPSLVQLLQYFQPDGTTRRSPHVQRADGPASSRWLEVNGSCVHEGTTRFDDRDLRGQLLATGPARRCEPPPTPRGPTLMDGAPLAAPNGRGPRVREMALLPTRTWGKPRLRGPPKAQLGKPSLKTRSPSERTFWGGGGSHRRSRRT